MSNISKRRRDPTKSKLKVIGNHNDFLYRITKSLYYGKLPSFPCLSLPVTEISAEIFSESQRGKTLKRLHVDDAAELTRQACVSPCSLVLAILYLERLKNCNPEYVSKMAPSELFLVSLMVSNKFLQDDGEDDEVFSEEWAASAGITSQTLIQIERNFLQAINWRVFVNECVFETALEWLEQQVALRQATLRGWFTYGDMANITNTIESIDLMKCLVTVYLALSVSYIASLSTLIASSLIASHTFLPFSTPRQTINIIGPPALQNGLEDNFAENDTHSYLQSSDALENDLLYGQSLHPAEDLEKLHIQNQNTDLFHSEQYHPAVNDTSFYCGNRLDYHNWHPWLYAELIQELLMSIITQRNSTDYTNNIRTKECNDVDRGNTIEDMIYVSKREWNSNWNFQGNYISIKS